MSKRKRVLAIIYSLLAVLIFSLACYIMIGFLNSEKNGKPYEYFGYSMHVVATDSMEPELYVGDMIFIKSVPVSSIKVGDDVLFKSTDPVHKGMTIVHRVVLIESDGDVIWLTTQGLLEGAGEDPVKISEIVGVKTHKSTIGGQIYLMVTTPSGWLIMVIITAAVVIIIKVVKNMFAKTEE